ncbi:MAG: glutaredoxin family protein [Gallionellaceae bacterium]|jgi:glutaredoxin
MRTILLTVCFLFVAMSAAHAASLYKWTDKDGKVHYGDKPAEDAVKTEQKRFSGPAESGDDDLSYGMRKAKQDFPVTLYVAPNCGDICVQARAVLNKRGIPFAEKNLEAKEDIDEFKLKYGGHGIPSLTIGKSLLSGFEAGQWNSELDSAGYPKIAPYGTRPKQPVAPKPVQPVSPEAPAEIPAETPQ